MITLVVFILFVLTVVILIELRERRKKHDAATDATAISDDQQAINKQSASSNPNCCGAHLICEQDLINNPLTQIIYYDDEELDQYKDIASNQYNQEQVDQFAEVLYTLQDNEVEPWLKSLQARGINLPDQLYDQALLIVTEARHKLL